MIFSLKTFVLCVIFSLAFTVDSLADARDPSGELAKYVMYGHRGVEQRGSGETATSGWVGTARGFSITGSLKFNTTVKTEGNLSMGVGSHTDSVSYVEGNLSYSQHQYGYIADTIYYGGNANVITKWGGAADPLVKNTSNMVASVSILPASTAVSNNGNNCTFSGLNGSWSCSGDNSGINGDTLMPGNYGAIKITGSSRGVAKFTAGTYEISSLTTTQNHGKGHLNIDKPLDGVTRIISQGGFNLTSGTRVYTNSASDLGRVLMYTNGNYTMNSGNEISATIYAPLGTITAVSNTKVFGQLLARKVVTTDRFNGSAGAFVGFDPVVVSLVGADTYEILESSDSDANTRNSRLVSIPIELKAATPITASVDYEIRAITATDTWGAGFDRATIGSDSATADLAHSNYGASPDTGTLTFNAGSSVPSSVVSFYVVDDSEPEDDVGGLEYFALILNNPSRVVLDNDTNASFSDGNTLIYLVPINSDDMGNLAPTDIATSIDTLRERAQDRVVLSGTDPDGNDANMSYALTGGADVGLFNLSNDTLVLKSNAIFENSNGTLGNNPIKVEVTATDEDGDTYAETLTLYISNRNDELPKANNDLLNLAEGGSSTVDVSTNDKDSIDNLPLTGSYSIVKGGTHAIAISFSGSSLTYTHNGSENFSDTIWYELNDGGDWDLRSKDTAYVVVTLSPVNDNQPILSSDTLSVSEGVANGFNVGTLVATDVDNDPLSYTLLSQEHPGAFALSMGGDLSVSVTDSIDYELDSLHWVEVQVDDGLNQVVAQIWIAVTNVNDNAPIARDTSFNILESVSINDDVGVFKASDLDGDVMTFVMIDQEYAGTFKINSLGLIEVLDVTHLDYEKDTQHTFKVVVSDGVNSDTADVVVNLDNVNDNNPTLNDTILGVSEDEANGFSIGFLVGSDADGGTLVYRLDSAEYEGAFEITGEGEVRVLNTNLIDYEADVSHYLFVSVLDPDNRTASALLTVNISNANDNPPIFNDTTIAMFENESVGNSIAILSASDADNSVLTFSIDHQEHANTFTLTNSGDLVLANASEVDYETDSTHLIMVYVTDGLATDSGLVTVMLVNVNDGTPLYNDTTLVVDEGSTNGTLISAHVGIDPDGDPLTYTIVSESINGMFEINPSTGVVSVLDGSLIDYETNTTVSMVVMASDGNNTSNATILFNVNNVNDNAPILNDTNFTVSENALNNDRLGTLVGSDADGNLNALIYSLDSAEHSGAFVIDSDGSIKVGDNSLLDYETDSTHALYVRISDGLFHSQALVIIRLSNSNDNAPVYNDTTFFISELLTNGSRLGSHLASDADGDLLAYTSITQDPVNTFTVIGSGEIILANFLNVDYEADSTLIMMVEVSDGVYADTAEITFILVNANDNSPRVEDTSFVVLEDAANSSSVGTMVASDADFDNLSFELITQEFAGAFSLDLNGDLSVSNTALIDFELDAQHTLSIRVGDGVFYDTALVIVDVENVNDNSPTSRDTSFSVAESSDDGSVVGRILAYDLDGDALLYTIVSQEYLQAFSMNALGELVIANSTLVDYETDAQHDLVIRISDGVNHIEINVLIDVTNSNDNSPMLKDTTFTISETTPVGSELGKLLATDADGNSLVYQLLSQEHDLAFSMSPAGILSVADGDSIDYELDDKHTMTVEVTDGVFSDTAVITVNITNENDNLPILADAAFTIDEDISNSSVVGQVIGSDADGSVLSYELVAQEYTDAFTYDALGNLFVSNTTVIDFEEDDTHTVLVRMISAGDTASATITITLNDKNDNLPVTRDTSIYINEDATVGRLIWTIPGDDKDVTDFSSFAVVSGNEEETFQIEPQTGRIYLDSALDFETTDSYTILVDVISNGDTVQSTVTINVINVNLSPVITVGRLFIEENTLAGSLVSGNIIAVDEDQTPITWRLPNDSLSDNKLFLIDPLTGQMSLKKDSTINYEIDDTLTVVIAASDDSSSSYKFVDIIVGDVNDAPIVDDQTLVITENSPTGVALDTILAVDEDINSRVLYSIIDSSEQFLVDSLTGEVSLKAGVKIDYEEQDLYSLVVIVDDGQFQDSASVTIKIENVIETANIEIVKIFDDSARSVIHSDEFYTSHDSVYLVLDKDGLIDTVKVGVAEGHNMITQTNNDPTKDISKSVTLDVTVSKVDPVLTVVAADSLPVDSSGMFHVNNILKDSIWIEITYVNKDLDTITIDSLVPLIDFVTEGEKETFQFAFEDEFGNDQFTTVNVLLDTTPPLLTILTPSDRSESEILEIDVDWMVVDNGDTLNFANVQLVSNGTFAVTREYTDFAGNKVSDTHYVKVKADDSGARVGTIDDVVQQKTEEEILEYFQVRNREADPAFDNIELDNDNDGIPDIEIANISVVLPNASVGESGRKREIELALQTEKGAIQREHLEEFETAEDDTRFGLTLELFFPINGGLNINGNARAGYIPNNYFEGLAEEQGWDAITLDSIRNQCDGDSTLWKLEVSKIQFHVFDHLGQYVTKLIFNGFSLDDPRYQDDKGKVTLKLELPQLKDGFKSESGGTWGSGIYILSGTVKTTATPRACLDHVNTLRVRTSSTNLIESVGYKREDK